MPIIKSELSSEIRILDSFPILNNFSNDVEKWDFFIIRIRRYQHLEDLNSVNHYFSSDIMLKKKKKSGMSKRSTIQSERKLVVF